MWFTSRNKSDKEHILSEKEIQLRLYGKYLNHPGDQPGSDATGTKKPDLEKHAHKENDLFGHEVVSGLRTAVVSKAMLEEPALTKRPTPEEEKSWAQKREEDIAYQKPKSKSNGVEKQKKHRPGRTLFAKDILKGEDKPNFRLEFEEWRARFKKFSVWHGVVILSALAGALVLFNVFVSLSVEQDRNVSFSGMKLTTTPDRVQGKARSESSSPSPSEYARSVLDGKADSAGIAKSSETQNASMIPSEIPGSPAAPAQPKRPSYVIQICIYESESAVKQLLDELTKNGYRGLTYDKTVTASKRALYRIYYGSYKSFSEAQQSMIKFRKDSLFNRFPDSFIRTVK